MRLIESSVCTIKELDLDAEAILASSTKMYDPAISTILMGTGAEETIPLFEKANVTMKEFLLLTDDDLKNIGVQLSETRREILTGVKKFHLKEWSEGSVAKTAAISLQEALNITMNSMKQLQLLGSSFKYVSDGLEEDSPPVPVNKDVPLTLVLCKCIDAAITANKQLNTEMRALKEVVNQMHLTVDSAEADYIPPAAETNSRRHRRRRFGLAAAGIVAISSLVVYVGVKTDFLSTISIAPATC